MRDNILELKNVSKFYYKKEIVSSGISNVNLKFDMGEFIAITRESGSGKSTLLNVIRPVISIIGTTNWKSGDGSANNPYELDI